MYYIHTIYTIYTYIYIYIYSMYFTRGEDTAPGYGWTRKCSARETWDFLNLIYTLKPKGSIFACII